MPLFGPTVAAEVAAQIRCMINNGTGAVDMTKTAGEFAVSPLPLDQWISMHPWDL